MQLPGQNLKRPAVEDEFRSLEAEGAGRAVLGGRRKGFMERGGGRMRVGRRRRRGAGSGKGGENVRRRGRNRGEDGAEGGGFEDSRPGCEKSRLARFFHRVASGAIRGIGGWLLPEGPRPQISPAIRG